MEDERCPDCNCRLSKGYHEQGCPRRDPPGPCSNCGKPSTGVLLGPDVKAGEAVRAGASCEACAEVVTQRLIDDTPEGIRLRQDPPYRQAISDRIAIKLGQMKRKASAFDKLLAAVNNNGVGDGPVGGVTVKIDYDPDTKTYEVDIDATETGCGSEAPTLALALEGLPYLDEGEWVLLSEHGRALCRECRGDGCDECGSVGFDKSPPHAWPKGPLTRKHESS